MKNLFGIIGGMIAMIGIYYLAVGWVDYQAKKKFSLE